MITSQQLYWAAGFLDGEGFFGFNGGKTLRVNAVQKDRWHLDQLVGLFGGKVRKASVVKNPHGSQIHEWDVYGKRAAEVMMTLYTLLSPRRQQRVRESLAEWKRHPTGDQWRKGLPGQYPSTHNRDKTHCKRGHEFTPENTYAKDGKYRQCRTCQREAGLRWYHSHTPLSNPRH